MITTATVEALHDGRVRLRCARAAACGPCSTGRGCAIRWLGGGRSGSLEVPLDPASAPPRVGEQVRVSLPESTVLASLAWMFLPPTLGLMLGALVGHGVLGGGDGAVLAAAGIGLCVGWALARWCRSSPDVSIERVPENVPDPS